MKRKNINNDTETELMCTNTCTLHEPINALYVQ